jgi:predicted phage-related endonuclease
MAITYHRDLEQGEEAWLAARRGLLTASEMRLILTPTLKPAKNEKERAHLFELLAQRISGYVEPTYIVDDMLRGMADEITARALYADNYAQVEEMAFITNDRWGFTIGYSPDGLVGNDGLIECKSRRQKYQIKTIFENVIPEEYYLQIQTGLLVSERKWLDFISYSGGLPMITMRAYPDKKVMDAIVEAATEFEERLSEAKKTYLLNLNPPSRTLPTERTIVEEMHL